MHQDAVLHESAVSRAWPANAVAGRCEAAALMAGAAAAGAAIPDTDAATVASAKALSSNSRDGAP